MTPIENVVLHGDCVEAMAGMDPESVDAIVTDPPYLIDFMGKAWDGPQRMSGHATPDADTRGFYQAVGKGGTHDRGMDNWRPSLMQRWHQQWAEAAYRVAKPSAYLLAFGGTRTVHRLTVALEDAGWIIRDLLVWAYASGFPKSKASLKPAWEPIVLARKPGPLRDLAIDACRIAVVDLEYARNHSGDRGHAGTRSADRTGSTTIHAGGGNASELGRWPANVVLTDPIFDGGVEGVVGGGAASPGTAAGVKGSSGFAVGYDGEYTVPYGDSGTYSRFFLVPKADRADREPVLGGLPERPMHLSGGRSVNTSKGDGTGIRENRPRANHHPTVKPTELMRHLVRLVTPSGGLVLDPFLGSGTTALAAEQEGFRWLGIEREAEYVTIAEARLNGTQRGLGLEDVS